MQLGLAALQSCLNMSESGSHGFCRIPGLPDLQSVKEQQGSACLLTRQERKEEIRLSGVAEGSLMVDAQASVTPFDSQ